MSGNAHQRRQARRHFHDRRIQPSSPVLNGNRETDPVEMLFDGAFVSGYPELADKLAKQEARAELARKVKRSESRRNLLAFAVVATLGAIIYLAIWAG